MPKTLGPSEGFRGTINTNLELAPAKMQLASGMLYTVHPVFLSELLHHNVETFHNTVLIWQVPLSLAS
jgi:hypothetical protein